MNRKGQTEFIMFVSEILFFVLLLIIALVLLSMQKGSLQTTRPQLDQDLANQRADAILMNTMRSPANGQFQTNIADMIVLDQDGKNDEQVLSAIDAVLKGNAYSVSVLYSTRTLMTSNSEFQASGDVIGASSITLPDAGVKLIVAPQGKFTTLPAPKHTIQQVSARDPTKVSVTPADTAPTMQPVSFADK